MAGDAGRQARTGKPPIVSHWQTPRERRTSELRLRLIDLARPDEELGRDDFWHVAAMTSGSNASSCGRFSSLSGRQSSENLSVSAFAGVIILRP